MRTLWSFAIRVKLLSPAKLGDPKALQFIKASPKDQNTGIMVNIANPMKLGKINVNAIKVFFLINGFDFIITLLKKGCCKSTAP